MTRVTPLEWLCACIHDNLTCSSSSVANFSASSTRALSTSPSGREGREEGDRERGGRREIEGRVRGEREEVRERKDK